jgi:ComF family protein
LELGAEGRRAETSGMFESGAGIVNRWRQLRLTGGRRWSRWLAATLFPPRCCLCGFPGASLDLDLCTHCHGALPWAPAGHEVLAALLYEHPVDDMVRELKYRGVIAHARLFGVLLAEAVRRRGEPLPRLLIPVPLHPARFRVRGFNQAATIARYAGRMLEIPVASHVVRRLRDTPSQTALGSSERASNVHAAFGVRGQRARRQLVATGHVAIVDDVCTTGSTLAELRHALRSAGVSRVDRWAVARVP